MHWEYTPEGTFFKAHSLTSYTGSGLSVAYFLGEEIIKLGQKIKTRLKILFRTIFSQITQVGLDLADLAII